MSDSAGGGESGGVAGAGQESDADSEPPQQAPTLPEGDSIEVGETSAEEAPPSAKRPRMSEEEQGLEQVAKAIEMHGETPAQAGLLQGDTAPPSQSKVPSAACFK